MEPCPSVGGVRDTRLVTHVDNLHPLARSDCEHFIEMISDQSKNVVNAETLRRVHK